MALPVITDTIRVAVQGTASNAHKWANVLHFRKTSALTNAAAIAIIDPLLLAHYNTSAGGGSSWRSFAPTTTTLDQFVYTPLDGTSASSVITHSLAGQQAGDALPASTALVVTLRTAMRGRSYRGRVYQGPWTEVTNGAGGTPSSTQVAFVAGQWAAFLAALVGTGASLVVASYLHSTAENVIAATVDARWDTQRRRLNS